jgi:hypothetical protein
MLRQAREIEEAADDRARVEARYRHGPQDNFALRFFRILQERPELASGFCAVLSDYLSSMRQVDPEVYEDLAVAEMTGPCAGWRRADPRARPRQQDQNQPTAK